MSFEEDLSGGVLTVSTCPKCRITVWPPSKICSRCFGPTDRRRCAGTGKVAEYSRDGQRYFCIAELDEGFRIMGSLSSGTAPRIGQRIRLKRAGMDGDGYEFEMSIV